MAQTKRKRRRKHRGTQAGTVEARGRTGRPRTATEAKMQDRQARREERLDTPPSWRSSLNRAALSAVVFGVLAVLLLNVPPASAIALTAVMVLLYLPLSYYTDRFIYNRRQRRKAAGGGR
jgi:Flp pilus assembly protein TadB